MVYKPKVQVNKSEKNVDGVDKELHNDKKTDRKSAVEGQKLLEK